MGNVWEAMKKHQAEQEQREKVDAAAAPEPSAGQAPAVQTDGEKPKASPPAPDAPAAPSSDRYAEVLVVHHDRGGRIAEQFRSLRTHVLAQCPDQRFCLMVTSAESGEGKTVSTLNLGLVMAERQERSTIIVDADLRKGRIAQHLQGKAGPGLSEVLRGHAALKDVIQRTAYPNLSFVSAGEAIADEVGELIHRPEFGEAVEELRRTYDYVLYDTPPVNTVADAGMIGGIVGDALLVVRMNKTSRDSVDRAIRLLHATNVKISGILLTHQKYFIPNYLYQYS